MIRWYRRLRFRRQLRQLAVVIKRIEATQTAMKWPRWKRKQFWRTVMESPRGRDFLIGMLRGM